MIQIDIDIPETCGECPFRDERKMCPLVAGIPAWQVEIMDGKVRSEHCPLKEVL